MVSGNDLKRRYTSGVNNAPDTSGLFLATVVRVESASELYVRVPRLNGTYEARVRTTVAGLLVGDQVYVALLEGRRDDLVAIGKAGGGAVSGGSSVVVYPSPPGGTFNEGDMWFDSTNGILYIRYDGFWVEAGIGIQGPPGDPGPRQIVSATAPSSPVAGDQWLDSTSGRQFVYYDGFWVEVGAAFAGSTGPAGYRNRVVNGGMDVWQRGAGPHTTQATVHADQYKCFTIGDTFSLTRQPFPLGNTIAGYEPTYYMRNAITSVAGAGNLITMQNRIEGVRTFAGQTATLSFWAKSSVAKNIGIELEQNFGTGGSPSTAVDFGNQAIALTTSWQRFTITVSIPSIVGKTVGSTGDDFLCLIWWLDAGATYATRSSSIGQLSATIDMWGVQLEAGPVATNFEMLPVPQVLALCQRYYEKSYDLDTAPGTATIVGYYYGVGRGHSATSIDPGGYIPFKVVKRGLPAMTGYNAATGASGTWNFANQTVAPFFNGVGQTGFSVYSSANSGLTAGTSYIVAGHWTASAEL